MRGNLSKHCNATGTAGGVTGQLQYNYESGLDGVDAGDPGDVLVSQGAGVPPKFQPGRSISALAISGSQDGDNRVFTLAIAPALLMLYRNGDLQREGDGNDFVLSGSMFTWAIPPRSDDWIFAIGY